MTFDYKAMVDYKAFDYMVVDHTVADHTVADHKAEDHMDYIDFQHLRYLDYNIHHLDHRLL
jgi:hypothetical protein